MSSDVRRESRPGRLEPQTRPRVIHLRTGGSVLLERAAFEGLAALRCRWRTCPGVQRRHSRSGRLMGSSLEERKSLISEWGSPLSGPGASSQRWEPSPLSVVCSSPWFCQAGGWGLGDVQSAATSLLLPRGDPSPGDIDRALNLSVPTSSTFGCCLVASP